MMPVRKTRVFLTPLLPHQAIAPKARMELDKASLTSTNLPPSTNGESGSSQLSNNLSAQPGREPSASESEKVMSVVEHLDELRTRLMRCLVYTIVGIALGLLLSKKILMVLQAPAGNIAFQALSLEEPLIVFVKVAFYAGLIIASPFILLEVSRFVGPGLTRKERQVITPIIVLSPFLFCLGAAFAYFCLLPSMIRFFTSFGQGISPVNQRLDFYVSLVSSILLYMGLCFQLPVIIFALSYTGLVTSKMLFSVWRYAIFGASIVAALVTPDPTAFSMLLVTAALSTLYLLSVLLLKLFGR